MPSLKQRASGQSQPKEAGSNGCGAMSCKMESPKRKALSDDEAEDRWVQCEQCDVWFHWICVGEPDKELDHVETWYCGSCLEEASTSAHPLKILYKQRKSTRSNLKSLNYANLDQGLEADPNRWANVVRSKPILPSPFRRMQGSEVNKDWLLNDPTSMTEPVIIEDRTGLGMRLPPANLSIKDVTTAVGPDTPVEVIDVASQSDLANWTLDAWARYYTDKDRSKIRNVISLEVTETPLGPQLEPPAIVAELDWVERFWPKSQRGPYEYPKVQKYCLMSVAKCWTDWHVDFAASSVWYHIMNGSKIFYFIRPTPENLAAYEKWSGSSDRQENTWLGDTVDAVYEVKLTKGNTMIIPTGWIHAVYTPSDSLVFGGNFLHSYNIATQLELYRIEIATRVPKKFRFPMFITLLWHVTKYYHDELASLKLPETPTGGGPPSLPAHLPTRILSGLKALSVQMLQQAAKTTDTGKDETGFTPEQRKTARNNVPWEEVPDPGRLATAFRKLVLAALGETEEDQERLRLAGLLATKKRKAAHELPPRGKPHPQSPSQPKTPTAPVNVQETETRQAGLLARPVAEGVEEGKPEPCTVVTKRKETSAEQVVRAGKKVIRVTRTVINIEEKVIWDAEARPEPVVPVPDMLPPSSQMSREPSERSQLMSIAPSSPSGRLSSSAPEGLQAALWNAVQAR